MNMIRLIASILLAALAVTAGLAQTPLNRNMFKTKHIGYAEGLSNQRVYSIVEDSNRVIWIATKSGIDRYNGYNLKNYTLSGDYHVGDLGGRRIQLLYDNRFGLWAYDNTGKVFRYAIENDRFELAQSLDRYIDGGIILNKLLFDQEGVLWFGLNSGLYRQEADGSVTPVLQGHYINTIVATGKTLFTGTSRGVMQLEPDAPAVAKTRGQDVQSLHYDQSKNELWAGTFNSGLLVIDLSTQDIRRLEGPDNVFLKPIRAITPYDTHTTLLGIDGGGVYTIDRNTGNARLLLNTDDDSPGVLQGNGIYAVAKDSQGNIWTGSYSGGVSAAILLGFPIKTYLHRQGTTQSLANDNVSDIAEDDRGNLWFATDNGISVQDVGTGRWKHLLEGTVTLTLSKSEDGAMWVSTYGNGIYQLDAGGRIVRHLTKDTGLSTNYVYSIKLDQDGELWVGGLDGYLQLIGRDGRSKHIYDNIKETQAIIVLDRHRVAASTTDGFYLIDKRNNSTRRYAATAEWQENEVCSYIVSMLFNDDHTVWLGTEGGGLNLYDMQTGRARTFTTRDGMPSDDVYNLQRDSRGRVWAGTGKGIAIVDNGRIFSLNYVEDVERVYNKSACTALSSGEFIYGSTKGAVRIDPAAIAVNDYQAPLRFTGLTTAWLDAEEAEALPPRLWRMVADGAVRLDYAYNSFTVTFEAINYRFRHDIAYQYMLDGYEKAWNEPTRDGEARYTRVAPGSYLLKVRSLRQSDGKVMAEQALRIEVAQPWWNTWWAWLLYVCLAGNLFWFIWRYKSNHLQKKYDEDKIRFFINTVHNIRTPVTLIMGPLEDLQKEQNLSDNARYFLKAARANTRRLNTLVTKLLEFEKMDTSREELVLVPLSLNDLLEEEAANFRNYCEKKGVQLSLSLPGEEVCIPANTHLMEMLLDNLLSNACKYTRSGGRVDLRLTATRRRAVIEVEDTGIGIPRRAQKHLFNKVGRLENARQLTEEGTGFGLLQAHRIVRMLHGRITLRSEEGRGTTFTVTLRRTDQAPAVPVHPTSEEPFLLPPEGTDEADSRNSKPHTLLVVEDHEDLLHYLHKTFEHDYRVIEATDGQKALECLSRDYPDLILSDLMMPGIPGDELCRRVKADPDTAGIPFVLLTAKAAHDDVVEGLKTGADDYIAKPFSTEILKLKVQGLINTRNRLRRYYMSQVLDNDDRPAATADAPQPAATAEPAPEHSEADQRFVQQATRLVDEHIADPDFDINALCREMAMSRTLFYSRLKSLTGNGPQEFIRLIRLNRAAELLRQGSTVAEAATDTGFVNVKYFSSLFKKQYGIQPSKYPGQPS